MLLSADNTCFACGGSQTKGCALCSADYSCYGCQDGYTLTENNTCSSGGLPVWAIVLIVIACLAVAGAIVGKNLFYR